MKAPTGLRKCNLVDLLILCQKMRPDEIEQYLALTGAREFNPETAALAFANTGGPQFTIQDSAGNPIAAGGYEPLIEGVWNSWMVGCMDGWATHWRTLTKGCRWLMDELFKSGARRLQTSALASRTQTHEWYERGLLMQREGTLRGFGVHGEDVACFSRINPDMELR